MPKKLTVEQTNGVKRVIEYCGRVYTEDNTLKAYVNDNSYDGHTEGFPLVNVWAYRVEEMH